LVIPIISAECVIAAEAEQDVITRAATEQIIAVVGR
jgi:hypothetical protein